MANNTRATLLTIREKAMASLSGPMAGSISVSGDKVSNMEKVHIYLKRVKRKSENGIMAEKYNGWKRITKINNEFITKHEFSK